MNNKLEVIGIDHGWSMMKTVSGLVTKLIVHYGWSGYSHVTLDGGLVGSSTQFVLN